MPPSIVIRPFEPEDADACSDIFYDAVHRGAVRFYDDQQRAAWAPERMAPHTLLAKIAGQFALVATFDKRVLGFMTLDDNAILDFAYVRPESMGTGVAASLYAGIVAHAQAKGMRRLSTHASELARRFFGRKGWVVDEKRVFVHNGAEIFNFAMSVTLPEL